MCFHEYHRWRLDSLGELGTLAPWCTWSEKGERRVYIDNSTALSSHYRRNFGALNCSAIGWNIPDSEGFVTRVKARHPEMKRERRFNLNLAPPHLCKIRLRAFRLICVQRDNFFFLCSLVLSRRCLQIFLVTARKHRVRAFMGILMMISLWRSNPQIHVSFGIERVHSRNRLDKIHFSK